MRKDFIIGNSLSSVFHTLIIAIFLLGLYGCGYKAAPFYLEDEIIVDENISFKLIDIEEVKTQGE